VLVPIVVSRCQLMMNILRHSKRRNGEQKQDKADCDRTLKSSGQTTYKREQSH
jgi:hypothetical protein